MVKTTSKEDLTPYLSVPARIYARLKDGQPHSKWELLHLLPHTDYKDVGNIVEQHVSAVRKNLPPDLEIVVVWIRRKLYYRLIRSVNLTPS